MRKLKKFSNKNPLFTMVVIYGPVAVGKYTVAKKLRKLINYKFFHNHHTHDLARQLFERGNIHLHRVTENIRFFVFKEIAEAKINVVTTHTYSSSYVSKTSLTDPMYMKKIESIIEKSGGRACFVHLMADPKEIFKRVSDESRKNFGKLRNKKILKEYLSDSEWKLAAPVKNNLIIDNTHFSPKKVATIIIKHFKIKPK
ncbi:hypothetical protein A3C67_01205 [Candidatus Nomurabacteria bacterium RIFCSPHIGHO2_02_FULL_42_19]|uniref:Uncharacterized protein n=1 Tax=Candidatus Nomurabacteria bacterium RIFCSPHIGHO2_02_FULL_42_19 TaxID=1801756 RepID=A0A1F6W210_9BACT|nr:MAG: hypothetical protein A3C67_01205 [Candidatus Nomurabacteria bacterium RIFCSPHIGHO2_02_FULL_42_19]